MKKTLLSSTALVGLLLASQAYAAPTVTVGGFADFNVGIADQDNAYQTGASSRDVKFQNDTEIHVKAEGTADNGLKYGAVIELEADVTADADGQGGNADKTYLFLESNIGRVELGSNTDAGRSLKVDASNLARGSGGIANRYRQFISIPATGFISHPELPTGHGSAVSVTPGATEDANKITYYSPRLSGIQVGVSYTPDQGDVGTASGFTGSNNGDQENVINAGVNYTADYGNVAVASSLTGEFGSSESATTEDLQAYALGLNLTFQGITVGGSYGNWGDSQKLTTATSDDSDYWTLGAAYAMGPAGVSVTYLESQFNDNDFNNLAFSADYQLAPGLTPYVEVNFFEFDPSSAAIADNDGSLLLLGTTLTF